MSIYYILILTHPHGNVFNRKYGAHFMQEGLFLFKVASSHGPQGSVTIISFDALLLTTCLSLCKPYSHIDVPSFYSPGLTQLPVIQPSCLSVSLFLREHFQNLLTFLNELGRSSTHHTCTSNIYFFFTVFFAWGKLLNIHLHLQNVGSMKARICSLLQKPSASHLMHTFLINCTVSG